MYEKYFGLSASPFQLNPDPSFLFESKGYRRAHAYLSYGIYQAEGFVVITGEVGAGKTTLLRALLGELDPGMVVAAQLVSTHLEADDLLRSVALGFGLPAGTGSKAELLAAIEAFLRSLVPLGKRALLVVDEAQNLSAKTIEELRMLSNFQFDQRALLQSFLVGQPELRDMMRAPSMQQLRQRIIASYHLGPLEQRETRAYVEHRLAHVGWKNNPAFDEEVFEALHRVAGGIPRRINTICNRLLMGALLAEKHRIGLAELDEAIAELREELGADALLPEAPAAAQGRPGAHGEGRGAGSLPPFLVSSLIARLDRIERNLASLLELTAASMPLDAGRTADRPGAAPARPADAIKGRTAVPGNRFDLPRARLTAAARGLDTANGVSPEAPAARTGRPWYRAGGK